jgi:hypothetical protein
VAREEVVAVKAEADRLRHDNDLLSRRRDVLEKEWKSEMGMREADVKRLSEEVGRRDALVAQLRAKGEAYDLLAADKTRLENALDEAKLMDHKQNADLQGVAKERDTVSKRLADAEQKIALVNEANVRGATALSRRGARNEMWSDVCCAVLCYTLCRHFCRRRRTHWPADWPRPSATMSSVACALVS